MRAPCTTTLVARTLSRDRSRRVCSLCPPVSIFLDPPLERVKIPKRRFYSVVIAYILRCGLIIVDYHAVLTGDVLLGRAQLSVDLLMSIYSEHIMFCSGTQKKETGSSILHDRTHH